MQENQSQDDWGLTQVGVRIPTIWDAHIQQKAKDGYRSKSDELRMLIEKGFEMMYGYNPRDRNKPPT